MFKKRLVRSLFLSYLWIALAAVVLIGYFGADVARESYLDQTADDLEIRARLFQRYLDLSPSGEEYEVDAACKEFGNASATRITVILPDGRVVGDSAAEPAEMNDHSDRPEIQEAFAGQVGRSTRRSPTLREELMYIAIPVERDGATTRVVRAAIPVTRINEAVGAIRQQIIFVVIVVTLVLAAVSLWVAARVGRPMQQMIAGAERFAHGDFEHRLPHASFAEANTLADALNHMASQLADRIQTIQRQQNELEAVLGSMEEGVLAVDNDGVVINVNQTCAELLGSEPNALKRRQVHEVVRKADLIQFIESSLDSSHSTEADILIRGKEDRWIHVHGTGLNDADERRMGTLIVLHDMTHLRRLENVRRDFVANVSHELKTPITSIKGFVETLMEGALDDHENATRFLAIISRQVNRLDAIIEDLLALSRLEKGAEEKAGRLEPGAVGDVLKVAVEMCEKKASDKEIDLELVCAADLVAPMNAHLLEQAVVNLVDNAIKYSEAGGKVRVDATKEGEAILIRVQDWGCGIEPKHKPRLFERFYRVDKARSRELGGTGLGLAIVKHIALVHGGSVSVESEVTVGSTFSIALPITTPAVTVEQ